MSARKPKYVVILAGGKGTRMRSQDRHKVCFPIDGRPAINRALDIYEAAGIQQMKFYEVGPNIALTAHSITVRPLCFSNKTFQGLPADLQAAITQAGKDAGLYGRVTEITEDRSKLAQMEKEGKLKTVFFSERDALIKAAGPVLKDYFAESGAADIYAKIMAVK